MSQNSDLNRREFLAVVAAAQGAFILGFAVPPRANAQSGPRPYWYQDSATPEINAWIVISPVSTGVGAAIATRASAIARFR